MFVLMWRSLAVRSGGADLGNEVDGMVGGC